MKTLNLSKRDFSTPTTGFGEGRFAAAPNGQESTMATVLMTRLHDARLENKFHRLVVMGDNEKVVGTYPLNRKITTVGRSRRNHIQLKDPLVSVKHLTISLSDDACVVNDLDSSNGTLINGQHLSGMRIMNDGDEIMIGRTLLRFASRQNDAPQQAEADYRMPFIKKKYYLSAAALCCLAVAAALVFQVYPKELQRYAARAFAAAGESRISSPKAAAAGADEINPPAGPAQSSYIEQALGDYSAGRLENARKTMKLLAAAKELTYEGFQAKQLLAMLDAVQDLQTQAQLAQEQKQFAKALDCWDRLLAIDVELLGDRPSFFAAQAEERVQTLSYDYAMDAFRKNNIEKARQLCKVILKIDPQNRKALALMAKLDSKA